MAEAIGLAASILTVIGCTVETLSLISDLRNAPKVVRDYVDRVKQLEDVMKSIQSSGTLDLNSDPLKSVIQDCMRDISAF